MGRSNEKSPNIMKEDISRKNNKLYNLVFEWVLSNCVYEKYYNQLVIK